MSRGTHNFKKSDLNRALTTAHEMNLRIKAIVFLPDGGFELKLAESETEQSKDGNAAEVENWLAKHHAD